MSNPPPLSHAELYAALHSGNPGDLAHYVEVCRGARTVLELGTGHGRIALPLAEHGLDVTSVEIDEGMHRLALERARHCAPEVQQRLSLLLGDMRRLDLDRTFDRILLPYNGLYCLGGVTGVLACLKSAAAHLEPEGEFWLDAYAADAFHAEAPLDDELDADTADDEPIAELEVRGRKLLVFEDTVWSHPQQKLEVTYRFYDEGPEQARREVGRHSIDHHYLLTAELLNLFDEAGLEVIHSADTFPGCEPNPEDELLLFGARRR